MLISVLSEGVNDESRIQSHQKSAKSGSGLRRDGNLALL
jgi:hypothetical protein